VTTAERYATRAANSSCCVASSICSRNPSVAIDGSKFKAVNNRDRNFTDAKIERRMEQIEQSIERYLAAMDTADRTQSEVAEPKAVRLKDKIEKLKVQMQGLKEMEQRLRDAPDGQVSLTDPDARSMATSGRGTGVVGYNVQTAVDGKHHLIVAHEVTNIGNDRTQLASMAQRAREATGIHNLTVVAGHLGFRLAAAVRFRWLNVASAVSLPNPTGVPYPCGPSN